MCIKCKRLILVACLRTRESLPQAMIVQLENNRRHICYPCEDCLGYTVYDSPLYSEEQARDALHLPSADTESARELNTELNKQLSILNRQNVDFRSEVNTYRNLIEQAEKSMTESSKKADTISQLTADMEELYKKMITMKNMPTQIEEQRRQIQTLTERSQGNTSTEQVDNLNREIHRLTVTNDQLGSQLNEAKRTVQSSSINAIKIIFYVDLWC